MSSPSSMSHPICHFFNKPGGCRLSNCRFRHVPAPTEHSLPWETPDFQPQSQINRPRISSTSITGASALAPFLTPAGLSRLSGVGSDVSSSSGARARAPFEVHNALRRFLRDNYFFRNAPEVYDFLELLNNATINNTSWTAEEGQILLSSIAQRNGLQRLNEILTWDNVSTRIYHDNSILSFQRGYIPLLQYLSSDSVVKSVLSHLTNAMYLLFMKHFESVSQKIRQCMRDSITVHRTFGDEISAPRLGGVQVFGTLITVLLQVLTRIKNATEKHRQLRPFVLDLSRWLDTWNANTTDPIPTFSDPLSSSPPQTREQICHRLRAKMDQLIAIVDREQRKPKPSPEPRTNLRPERSMEGTLAVLHNTYIGPGDLRPDGPRHDNDFVDIADIRIAPTDEELTSSLPPFLPANLYGAPHPLSESSMEKLLDIQFRLLREELTASLRVSVQHIIKDLKEPDEETQLATLLQRRGGKYIGHTDGQDNVTFNVYTNAQFIGIWPDRRGISVYVNIDPPPGKACSPDPEKRAAFWEGTGGKRLLSGGLVALIWQRASGKIDVHVGTIASSARDHIDSARSSADRITIRISFFDPQADLYVLHELRRSLLEDGGIRLLIEATVMFASVRPFLEALRVEPTSIPFAKYLVHHPSDTLNHMHVDPPAYAKEPHFKFQLASLFPAEEGVQNLELCVTNEESIRVAREALRSRSRLDPGQSDAVVDALTREVALIQGPPGTGKSYIGVELLRVLLANGVGPVLMIAFTNHALDHMLCTILDAQITRRIVRLGSRSAEERIQSFSITAIEGLVARSNLSMTLSSNYYNMKEQEKKFSELMSDCFRTGFDTEDLMRWLELEYPALYKDLTDPPQWIDLFHKLSQESAQPDGGYIRVDRGEHEKIVDDSIYAYWSSGEDLAFLNQAHTNPSSFTQAVDILNTDATTRAPGPATGSQSKSFSAPATVTEEDYLSALESLSDVTNDHDIDNLDDVPAEEMWMFAEVGSTSFAEASKHEDELALSSNEKFTRVEQPFVAYPPSPSSEPIQPSDFRDVRAFFAACGYEHLPPLPTGDRKAEALARHDSVWTMSSAERLRLQTLWSQQMLLSIQQTREEEYKQLRGQYLAALDVNNEVNTAVRCELLRNVDIIGCTTTGAANLTALLKTIGPRVLLVEEAGQVLEAHVLGSLVPSIQHTLLIGDPLQLRPRLNNYSLSIDHRNGGKIYKFDQSLMERLSSSGLPMSQINVQRRMRPSISDLIRFTLYPKLEDHPLVEHYPHARGMHRDVFFMTHNHKENGAEEDAISKYNQFEVDMIVDLVMYFLRQGPYSEEGDIVVLCAYLGQLARVRDALSDKVAVVIDERDQRDLADREGEHDDEMALTVGHVKVMRRVHVRTIDNFQGEEAKIVILSLVRNSGGSDENEGVRGLPNFGQANIGFLRSENRINVALSRAREGLYILGNAKDLSSQSKMWRDIITHLTSAACIGDAIPIACQQHRDSVQFISMPGELPQISPDGGCLIPCNARLSCGHLCPFKCHSDDPRHLTVKCEQLCTKLCPRNHPCSKPCGENCGHCTTPVHNVELPCGHLVTSVACGLLDDLSQVRCTVRTRKQLPTCEHDLEMGCSDDPALFDCLAICGGILACCGRNCKEQCSHCQSANGARDENAAPRKIERAEHCKHPCQKRLYCEHPCAEMCAREHVCTTVCREPCRQVCPHSRCRDYCSKPCAPCQEPCTWKCPHFQCPVPCGSICARLPCDRRCKAKLRCGHQCPSVCGEECNIQICPICASDEERNSVVDLVTQRTLAEVYAQGSSLDELLITIPACRHVFTVETLDGHCSMADYYGRDSRNERWIGLQTPPPGFRRPPTCPTCRAAITCHRYGRVFKRADLDILENNVASNMSQSIQRIVHDVRSFRLDNLNAYLYSAGHEKSSSNVSKPPHSKPKLRQRQQRALLRRSERTPLPHTSLDPAKELHGAPLAEARIWKETVKPVLSAYLDATSVAATRSAHAHAWEASFSYLCQKELQRCLHDLDHAPRNPQEHAMRMASMGVGQPRPVADQRFLVEAFWLSINIRITLAQLTQAWLAGLCNGLIHYPVESRRIWHEYMAFLYRSCSHDAQSALSIAEGSGSYRQAMKAHLVILRVDLEQFQFNIEVARKMRLINDQRAQLIERAEVKSRDARQQAATAIQNHLLARKSHQREERVWLAENFEVHTHTIFDEWEKLKDSLFDDSFHEPLSLHEMEDIVRGLSFPHTGHFYKCPRGHTFVIDDCGGATQISLCPECGELIGGYDHERIQGNQRAMDFEQIAMEQGAERSPFRWGQLDDST